MLVYQDELRATKLCSTSSLLDWLCQGWPRPPEAYDGIWHLVCGSMKQKLAADKEEKSVQSRGYVSIRKYLRFSIH